MVFGEIVEPSSRALIDDECYEYPEYNLPEYKWTGNRELLSNINSLVIIETKRINELFLKFILQNADLICKLNQDLTFYKKENNFIVLYEDSINKKSELTMGQVVEALEDYVKQAKQIFTVTSSSFSSYQGELNKEISEYMLKCLCTKNSNRFNCDNLKTPNLITGLGANVLSYCIYNNLECSSFILYINSSPIDSINSEAIIRLAEKMSLSPCYYNLKMNMPSHNLYM